MINFQVLKLLKGSSFLLQNFYKTFHKNFFSSIAGLIEKKIFVINDVYAATKNVISTSIQSCYVINSLKIYILM